MLYVSAEKYDKVKRDLGGMGMEMTPVDLNYAYVALDVTEASKNSPEDMNKSAECNLKRFGLEQY